MHKLFALAVLLLITVGCTGELEAKIAEQEQALTTAEARILERDADLSGKDTEIAELERRVAALEAENTELKQTAQYFFSLGVDSMTAKDWGKATEHFTAVVERFPADPLASEAMTKLQEVTDAKLGAYLGTVDGNLSLSSKLTYSTAAATLEGMIGGCSGCSNVSAAKTKLREIGGTLEAWPEAVDSIATLKLRYSDLKGKSISLASVTVEADTYFNCGFDSDYRWRSFKLSDGGARARLNGYCRKGTAACDALFERAVSSPRTISSVLVKYPWNNRTCGEKQIELVSWSL